MPPLSPIRLRHAAVMAVSHTLAADFLADTPCRYFSRCLLHAAQRYAPPLRFQIITRRLYTRYADAEAAGATALALLLLYDAAMGPAICCRLMTLIIELIDAMLRRHATMMP